MSSPEVAFPRPHEKLVLFDIDETLIDRQYTLTDEGIYQSFQEAQEAGWTIGLSSDKPYEAMRLWSQRLDISGPLIAERGAAIAIDGSVEYDAGETGQYRLAAEAVERYFLSVGSVVWKGNPPEFLRSGGRLGNPGDTVVLMNSMRKNSLALLVRVVDEAGELRINTATTNEAIGEIRQFYPDYPDLAEDVNHDYGVLILSRSTITKRFGSQRLLAVTKVADFAMVGNSMTDYVGDDIATHYAVANATEAFKEHAVYTASLPLTSGCIEIIKRLQANCE